MTEYPWTPEGLELLRTIETFIAYSGGAYKLATKLELEWGGKPKRVKLRKALRHPPIHTLWTPTDEAYLLANFMNMGVCDVAIALNRSQDAVFTKFKRLREGKYVAY